MLRLNADAPEWSPQAILPLPAAAQAAANESSILSSQSGIAPANRGVGDAESKPFGQANSRQRKPRAKANKSDAQRQKTSDDRDSSAAAASESQDVGSAQPRNTPSNKSAAKGKAHKDKGRMGVRNGDGPAASVSDGLHTQDSGEAATQGAKGDEGAGKKRGRPRKGEVGATTEAGTASSGEAVSKAVESSQRNTKGKGEGRRGKWWKRLVDDDPISLEPLSMLAYQPFNLKASDTVDVWFDPKVLANYLVSTGNLVHPVNRRALTREDCETLDKHLQICHIKKAGVTEVFEHQERMRDPSERILYLQEQASSIMQTIFAGASAVSDGARPAGRRQPQLARNPTAARERATESQSFVIDDDEAYSYFGEEMPRGSRAERSRGALPSQPSWADPQPQEEAWPELLSSGPLPAWPAREPPPLPSHAAPAQEPDELSQEPGAVFHVSNFANPDKIETRHIYSLFSPHDAVVKWLHKYGALVYTPTASAATAAAAVRMNDKRNFHVTTLQSLEKTISAAGRNAVLTDFRGKKGKSIPLPSLGELRFLITHLKTKNEQEVATRSWQETDGEDDETRYQNWLKSRWQQRALAAETSKTVQEEEATAGSSDPHEDTEAGAAAVSNQQLEPVPPENFKSEEDSAGMGPSAELLEMQTQGALVLGVGVEGEA